MTKSTEKQLFNLDNFIEEQKNQIYLGFINGLTLEQIKLYANKEFTVAQMGQIRLGLENGLTLEQVKLYANKEFGYLQMNQIRLGLEHGLTIGQVTVYASHLFDPDEMERMRNKVENRKESKELILECLDEFFCEEESGILELVDNCSYNELVELQDIIQKKLNQINIQGTEISEKPKKIYKKTQTGYIQL